MKTRYANLMDRKQALAPAPAYVDKTSKAESSNADAGSQNTAASVPGVTAGPAIPGHVSPVISTGSSKMTINYGAALGDAASSAAAGMMFGPPGAILGGVMGFAVDVVPGLFPHLFGKNSAQVQAEVKSVVANATGGKTDVSDVQAAIATDPSKADEVKQRLAEIVARAEEAQRQAELQQRQADLEQMKLAFADTANARGQTADLAKAGSPLAWGAPVISVVVLVMFALIVLVAIYYPVTDQSAALMINTVLGTLAAMSTAVVTYWVGSSAGSIQKTALLAKAPPIT